tara:strand:+ start:409 stop:540 length:132 start_codon:yes stop_codon:yes gene_type:complete
MMDKKQVAIIQEQCLLLQRNSEEYRAKKVQSLHQARNNELEIL